jgi:hypothetical protein
VGLSFNKIREILYSSFKSVSGHIIEAGDGIGVDSSGSLPSHRMGVSVRPGRNYNKYGSHANRNHRLSNKVHATAFLQLRNTSPDRHTEMAIQKKPGKREYTVRKKRTVFAIKINLHSYLLFTSIHRIITASWIQSTRNISIKFFTCSFNEYMNVDTNVDSL